MPATRPASRRRTALGVLAAATAASLLPALTALPAQAAGEYYPLPAEGAWQVSGHGYGHGRGLSQWGAQGAALQGVETDAILNFYYPGTATRSIGDPLVRVLLTAPSSAKAVTFFPRTGAPAPTVATVDGRTLQGPYLTLRPEGAGLVAEVRQGLGGPVTASGAVPAGTAVRTDGGVWTAAGAAPTSAVWYRGDVVVRTANGFEVVNELSMQNYLYGVVPREVPAGWHPAALRAQSVAARTYEQAVARPTSTQDICDTTSCQVYGGRERIELPSGRAIHAEDSRASSAVDATAGQIRTVSLTNPAAAFTQFSSSSGGWSTSAGPTHPYLVSRADPWSGSAPGDPVSSWTATLTADAASEQCAAGGRATGLTITSRDGNGEWGGRITGLTIHCTTGPVEVATELSRRLGMRSSWWRPAGPPSRFLLTNGTGSSAEIDIEYGPRGRSDVLVGDWSGSGVTGIGYREGNILHLRDTPDAGEPTRIAAYGRPGDHILVGDWDGTGTDTVAVRRANIFHLRNVIGDGPADEVVPYGKVDDEVFVGDWDGDGIDTPGVRRGNEFHLKNSWTGGAADIRYDFGRVGDVVVVGDWDGSGIDRPAVRRGNIVHIPADFAGGVARSAVPFGRVTDLPLAGDWDGDGRDTLGLHRLD